MKRETGRNIRTTTTGEPVDAFVPHPLPPSNPPLELSALADQLALAQHNLARLDLAGEVVPSLDWFVYAFARKEAVLSSQIEGTQATLVDLLQFEAGRDQPAIANDIEEVFNYLAALKFARDQLRSPSGLPLSLRLFNETHRILMTGARGQTKQPGEIRRSQNWLGGTRPGNARFVPPPPEEVLPALSALEGYIHASDTLPPLIRIGLLHVQFETIHPYLDGNGRMGRLLITLLLEHWRLLQHPLLYLSLYFKRHRSEYYERLNGVRGGDWEGWLQFFLEGVANSAADAIATARNLFALTKLHQDKLVNAPNATVVSIRLLNALPAHPIMTIPAIVALLGVSKPAAGKAVSVLAGLDLLVELTGHRRDRVYAYQPYLEELRTGTDAPE